MHLKSLHLRQFRCYGEATFHFSPGINLIHGANARGKSSILEAIYLLSTGRSFRASKLQEMIQSGKDGFEVEAKFVKHGVEQTLTFTLKNRERSINYNQTPFSSITQLFGLLPGVIITPDDIALIKGSPQVRRQYLDLQLAQANSLYVHHLIRYHRAMRQRNALLKNGHTHSLDSWEHVMAHSGAFVTEQRITTAAALENVGSQLYATLTGEAQPLHLEYKAPWQGKEEKSYTHLASRYLEKYRASRQREMAMGYTLHGPHKDDLAVALGGKEVRLFASEGQQRCCVATLRFAEWQRLRELTDEVPLLFVDDIGISLDESRQEKLVSHLASFGQVFVTSTHELDTMANRIRV